MNRLGVASVALWLGLLALCSVGVLVGRTQPLTPVLDKYDLKRCDVRLCFEGLEPGISSWTSAVALFANRSELMYMNNVGISLLHNKQDNVTVDLRSGGNGRVIAGELNFRNPNTAPTIGTLVLDLGAPCQVSISESLNDDILNLMYPSSIIQFELLRVGAGPNGVQAMTVNTPIYVLAFQDTSPRNCDALLAVYPVAPWMGFASAGRYVAASQ